MMLIIVVRIMVTFEKGTSHKRAQMLLLFFKFVFRPKEKSSKQIEDLIISLQDFEKHKNDPNTVLTRSHFFAVIQHVELVRQNTLTEDNVSFRRVSF